MASSQVNKNTPRQAEIAVVDCFCDHVRCGKRLDKLKTIWVWNEHFACSRDHVQKAQGETNYMASVRATEIEERDIDLL